MARRGLLALALVAGSAAAQEPEGAAAPEPGSGRPRIGLVLSGGGARGSAHVGVLQVLEELHVPVDFVVGTSMGAIVGGLYASGYSPDELARILAEADWPRILSDAPEREDLWYRRRQDDRVFQIDLELGWSDGALVLPPGLILGLNVEGFLQELLPGSGTLDFDELRLPFRCVATDIADGSAFVFEEGSLPRAIRSSMSLPGVFAPVEVDGRLLVDGGVVDNLPVGVARSLGADVVIAVDISTPLADPSALRSLFGVSGQVIGIMMSENRRRSLESLTEADIGIVPDLGDLTTMAFGRSVEAIGRGRAAADELRERLAGLGVDPETWERWRNRQRRPAVQPPRVGQVLVRGNTRLSSRVIRETARLEVGDVLEPGTLTEVRQRLAGLGIFEHVEIDVTPVPGVADEVIVVLRPIEKAWGPHYLRFRIGASSDLSGSGDFDLGVQHTWTPFNRLGGEWRTEVQVGTLTRIFSEFYQPLDSGLRWFVSPSVEFQEDDLPLIVDREKVAEVNVQGVELALSLGRNLGSWGEARVRYGWIDGHARPEISIPGLLPSRVDFDRGQVVTSVTADTRDAVSFPRRGVVGRAAWSYSDDDLGAEDRLSIVSGLVGVPVSFGDFTLFPFLEGGSSLENDSLVTAEFFLGGFQRLSGLGLRELAGNHYALGVLNGYYRFADRTTQFGTTLHAGASLELGGIWEDEDDVNGRDLMLAGSVYAALDTFLGPIYLAFGLAEGGERAAYLFISPTF